LKNFTSELSLEILASVDFILSKCPNYTVSQVADAMWTRRKKELFRLESIEKAYNHLHKYKIKLLIK